MTSGYPGPYDFPPSPLAPLPPPKPYRPLRPVSRFKRWMRDRNPADVGWRVVSAGLIWIGIVVVVLAIKEMMVQGVRSWR